MTSRTWRSRAANEFSTWWRPMLWDRPLCCCSLRGRQLAAGKQVSPYRLLLFGCPRPLATAHGPHRHLPFGTHVRVTRLHTGTPIVVRVNDRGPFITGRIIDLSRAAAARLGMLGKGIVRVRIEVVPPPTLTAELHSGASTPCAPCREPLLVEKATANLAMRSKRDRPDKNRRERDAAESGSWPTPSEESYAENS